MEKTEAHGNTASMLRHPITAVGDGSEAMSIEMGIEAMGVYVIVQEGNIEWKKKRGLGRES